jgi:hypothetical protein
MTHIDARLNMHGRALFKLWFSIIGGLSLTSPKSSASPDSAPTVG